MARAKSTRLSIALVALAALFGTTAASAMAYETGQSLDSDQFAIEGFTTATSTGEAGARTNYNTTFSLKHESLGGSSVIPYGRTKKVEFDLPPGLTGNPTNLPTCPRERFFRASFAEMCPFNTILGWAHVEAFGVSELEGIAFNLEPGPNEPALIGLKLGVSIYAFLRFDVSSDGEITQRLARSAACSKAPPQSGAISSSCR